MALRAGSVGLGREAGLGARRGWTRRRRPPPTSGETPSFPPGPALPSPRGAPPSPASSPWSPPPSLLPRPRGGRGGCGGARARGPRGGGSNPARAGAGGTRGPPVGGGPDTRGGPAAAATLDASRALPVDRPSCGGRRGRSRGARRVAGAGFSSGLVLPLPPPRGRGFPGFGVLLRVGGSPAGCAPRAAVSRAAPRLGRRLAADLELVRTRGIRLFN